MTRTEEEDRGGGGIGHSSSLIYPLPTHNRLPSNVGCDKGDTDTHDDGEGLEGDVVLEGLDGEALGRSDVVQLPASLTHEVGVVSSIEKLGEKHLKTEQTLTTDN